MERAPGQQRFLPGRVQQIVAPLAGIEEAVIPAGFKPESRMQPSEKPGFRSRQAGITNIG
jgi:hypothetical protein